jgi:hypothetical protein
MIDGAGEGTSDRFRRLTHRGWDFARQRQATGSGVRYASEDFTSQIGLRPLLAGNLFQPGSIAAVSVGAMEEYSSRQTMSTSPRLSRQLI